jgi:hypothetical protein
MGTPVKPNDDVSEREETNAALKRIEDAFNREQALQRGMPYVPSDENKNRKVSGGRG